jgi:prepilin-type N-terminal cleavage/methylation domain-containing protein/prepilin-type processing-associated H-X9-DG protein
MHKRKGFTLIELLVVISVIALLIAILTPTLSLARKQAHMIYCRSNLHNIGVAASLYAANFNDFVPRALGDNPDLAWFQLFMPFLAQKNATGDYSTVKIYRCPAYPDKKQTICYVINGWNFSSKTDNVGSETINPSKLTNVKRKAETSYLVDNESGSWRPIITKSTDTGIEKNDVWAKSHLPDSTNQTTEYGRRVAKDRHKDGCNVLFLDWHADKVAAKDMTVDLWRFDK